MNPPSLCRKLAPITVLLLGVAVVSAASGCFGSGGSGSSLISDSGGDHLSFCHFGPKMKVLEPVTSSDHCSGTAKIQGVLWECGPPDVASATASSMSSQLASEAAQECERHCADRADGCHGVLLPVTRCGLSTDHDDAVVLGKRLGCQKSCAGPGFIYCSLYDAGFHDDDPEKISHQSPNCRCVPKS